MTKFSIVFAGQGSQSVGMMSGFSTMPVVQRTFEEASAILSIDLWNMIVDGPADVQNQTVNTQPLMLTAGVATYRAWLVQGGVAPSYFAGHSLGEFTALVAAGALAFSDALPLVRFRAEAMQEAVPAGVGAIAALLGLDADHVRAVCADAAQGEVVEAVNLNSPGQIVIAGHKAAVARAIALATERGAKRALLLPMSVPSHCALMKPAAEKLASYLQNVPFTVPQIPVIQNADVKSFATVAEIKQALVEQLFRPVRWIETIQALSAGGTTTVIECVPGKILTGLNKRIVSTLDCIAVTDAASLAAGIDGTRK